MGDAMDELWIRSVETICDGKLEDFKWPAGELLSRIRAKDSNTLNYAIFLNEPTRAAVFLEHYTSSAGWFGHHANLGAPTSRFAKPASSRPSRSTVTRRRRRAALAGAGPAVSYHPALSAVPAVRGAEMSAQLSPEEVVRRVIATGGPVMTTGASGAWAAPPPFA